MGTTTSQSGTGRVNQKLRTRTAIVNAATELMLTGCEVTMLKVAKAALVSEATAYRYFPDLASLLAEAMVDTLPDPAEALAGVADSLDPVARVAAAAEYLARHVLARAGAIRAMIAATIVRPETADRRPGLRFGLIDQALRPWAEPTDGTDSGIDAETLVRLKRDLSVVMGAEMLFGLIDLSGLDPETAVESIVRMASTLTRSALPSQRETTA
jgi:AcrR family transcriptional regulator